MDAERRQIRMYYHGAESQGIQITRVAVSDDGISFTPSREPLGAPYYRVFRWGRFYYALGMPGILYRSSDGLSNFKPGPTLFTPDMRHSGLKLDGDTLSVFYTNAHDAPENLLLSTIQLGADWMTWTASEPVVALEPEMEYEGADLPVEPSKRGPINERARQLRDPGVFRDDGRPFLPNTVTQNWIKLARRVGLHGVRFHDARHTHASLMLRQGVHPKMVQERLGHSSIAITLDTYSHVAPGLQEAAAAGFDVVFGQRISKRLANR